MQRDSALAARRAAVARCWDLASGGVLVAAGLPVPIAGTDQFYDFHAHPEFTYLAGLPLAGAVMAFDPREGWRLFVPVPSIDDRVWDGDGPQLAGIAVDAAVEVTPLDALGDWIEQRRGEALAVIGNHDLIDHPESYRLRPWHVTEADPGADLGARLSGQVAEARRAKDAAELELMRAAAEASRAGHLAALRVARAGMTERQLQVELEVEFLRAGADRTAYDSIVGSGNNAAVLHFSPTRRQLRDGEVVLIDAGAEFGGYASDVTRTFPVGSAFEGIHRDLYQLVLSVQRAAISEARPGIEYRELHLRASGRIAAGLVDLGILKGNPDSLVERDAHALFFPHGLGHMLGLATHDAGGCLAGRLPSDRFGLKWLRADLPLEPGYVVTIEPGIYFIRALLQDAGRRATFRDAVDWAKVDTLLDAGGIRIEDDVLVTEGAPEVLTGAIPSSLDAIEGLRREALEA